jgi:hypothetical protein
LEQQQHADVDDFAELVRTSVKVGETDAARATKNSGGWTLFCAAHSSFSRSEWQQHLSQQKSAVVHPQGQSSHGKRPSFAGAGAEIGNPIMPTANSISSETPMNFCSG